MQKKSWAYWKQVFDSAREKNKSITLTGFCKENGLKYDAARKGFQKALADREKAMKQIPENRKPEKAGSEKPRAGKHKYDWSALKVEFLKGDFKTTADFARIKGIPAKSANFYKKTKGWAKEKAAIWQESEQKALASISDISVAMLHGEMLGALADAINILKSAREKHADVVKWIESPLDLKFFIGCADELLKVAERFMPFYQKISGSKEALAILEKYRIGEIDVQEAAIQFDLIGVPLPQSIKIGLSKTPPPEEAGPPGGEVPTDEELERLYQEGMAEIEKQESFFVPARQKEVQELKDEMKKKGSYGGGDGGKENE